MVHPGDDEELTGDPGVAQPATLVAQSCRSNAVTGSNIIRVSVVGATIRVVVNGALVLTWTDPEPLACGGVGVGSIWETTTLFDNVLVTREPPPAR